MQWTVESLNKTVEDEIASLPEDMQAYYVRIVERIQQIGLEHVREPHIKHIEGKLWEMRLMGRAGIARALYVTIVGKRVVVLRAFIKKTQKTPRAEIVLAQTRIKELVK